MDVAPLPPGPGGAALDGIASAITSGLRAKSR